MRRGGEGWECLGDDALIYKLRGQALVGDAEADPCPSGWSVFGLGKRVEGLAAHSLLLFTVQYILLMVQYSTVLYCTVLYYC